MELELTEPRPYHALRKIVEDLGGSMRHEKEGHPQGGVWVVQLPGCNERVIEPDQKCFLALARFYKPRPDLPNPKHATEYSCTLIDGGREKWLEWLRTSE
jgi:hypothetical protein